MRSDERCPFCGGRGGLPRTLLLVPALAVALLPTLAHAADAASDGPPEGATGGDAMTSDVSAEDDGPDAGNVPREYDERQARPLYGVPPPPGCRSGCEVGASTAPADAAGALATIVAVTLTRRRRRRS